MKGCLCSVEHTGTHFTWELMRDITGEEVVPWLDVIGKGMEHKPDFDWLHFHLSAPGYRPAHLYGPIMDAFVEGFVERAGYPTVVPIRDPVLAIISRNSRAPANPVIDLWQVSGFEKMAEWYQGGRDNVFFFPVDLYDEPADRGELLGGLVDFLGFERDEPFLNAVAGEWTPINPQDDTTGLKQHYLDGQICCFSHLFPEILERLREGPVLGLMAGFGYDLPWMASA